VGPAGRQVGPHPLWRAQAVAGRGYESLAVWQQYATDVGGEALPTGHFLAEESRSWSARACASFLD
jgi:haloacetate dehalogenase